jgi:hypothetical protein
MKAEYGVAWVLCCSALYLWQTVKYKLSCFSFQPGRQERSSPSFFYFPLSLRKSNSLFLLDLFRVSANSRLIPAASRRSNQLPYQGTNPTPTLSQVGPASVFSSPVREQIGVREYLPCPRHMFLPTVKSKSGTVRIWHWLPAADQPIEKLKSSCFYYSVK